eukprot:g885.t1
MRLFVRDVGGQTLSLEADGQVTVDQLKAQIALQQGLPVDEQQLIFGGKSLENTQRRVFGVCFLGLGDGQKDAKKQLPENLRSVREGHLTHRGATALFRTLRTLGPAATALLLGLVLLAAVTLAAFGGTARWSASAPVLLTDVLDPGPLQYWHCSKEAGHGGRRRNYKRIVSLPSMEHDGFHGEKLNACAMNNLDEYIYCVLQVRKDKKYELYIVRVGIVDYDTKLAGIHFAPSYKVHKDCQGADYAFWEKAVDGKKLKILWMLRDFKVTALDVTTPGQATCKVWKSDGIPSNTRGHYGAGWTFKKPDGSVAVYFSNNAGGLSFYEDTIHMYKVGESEATSKNDGANCMSMSSVSPFKAEPPKIIWPANHVDRVLTIAHVCHDPPPCQLLPLSTPLTREDCQKRCMEFENCRGVEYRHSEDRCEILARPTEWFIDNTKHRTVGGPLDFECWLYKPTCDVLIQLRDHGAHLLDCGLTDESTVFVSLELQGGGKKRKKKTCAESADEAGTKPGRTRRYTKPKKIKHKRKKVKLAVLKFYKVDSNDKVTRLRRECPDERCGPGVFMAMHFNRYYCGRCHLTYLIKKDG